MKIYIRKLDSNAALPTKAHDSDVGHDVYANEFKQIYTHNGGNNERLLEGDKLNSRCIDPATGGLQLAHLERALIGTGLSITADSNHEIQVRPRSGNALKKGLTVLNSPGTIDPGYRDELCIILVNLSRQTQIVNIGDRIAQLVVQPITSSTIEEVNELPEATERNKAGFGSTGE